MNPPIEHIQYGDTTLTLGEYQAESARRRKAYEESRTLAFNAYQSEGEKIDTVSGAKGTRVSMDEGEGGQSRQAARILKLEDALRRIHAGGDPIAIAADALA